MTALARTKQSVHPAAHSLELRLTTTPAFNHETQRLAQREVARAVPARIKSAQQLRHPKLATFVQQSGNYRQEIFAGRAGSRKKPGGDTEGLEFDRSLVRMGYGPLQGLPGFASVVVGDAIVSRLSGRSTMAHVHSTDSLARSETRDALWIALGPIN